MIILDTDFLIDLLKDKKDAVAKMENIQNQTLAISVITILELQTGALKKGDEFSTAPFEEGFTIIPFNTPLKEILAKKPVGIIFSGGPSSVNSKNANLFVDPYEVPELRRILTN